MERGIKKTQADARLANGLESYRQLVELQKEMIRLAKQNERARQECLELRERVALEVITHRNKPEKANDALKKSSGETAEKPNMFSLLAKQS